jgi:protein SCO1
VRNRNRSRIAAAALAAMIQGLSGGAVLAHDGRIGSVSVPRDAIPHGEPYKPPAPHTLGGPFELIDHTGRTVTDRTFRGSWMLIFFGFTACREACPDGLLTMTKALEAMGPDADRVQPLFIDFSMEEPDIKGLEQFVGNFHPRLIGLTGTRAQTFAVVRQFKVRREYAMMNYSSKETGPRINHTTHFYLVDPNGKMRAYFYHNLSPEKMAAVIRQHVSK